MLGQEGERKDTGASRKPGCPWPWLLGFGVPPRVRRAPLGLSPPGVSATYPPKDHPGPRREGSLSWTETRATQGPEAGPGSSASPIALAGPPEPARLGRGTEVLGSAPPFLPRQEHGDTGQDAARWRRRARLAAVNICARSGLNPGGHGACLRRRPCPALGGRGSPVQAAWRPGGRCRLCQAPRLSAAAHSPTPGPASWSVSASLRRYVRAQGSDARHRRQPGPGPEPANRRPYPA